MNFLRSAGFVSCPAGKESDEFDCPLTREDFHANSTGEPEELGNCISSRETNATQPPAGPEKSSLSTRRVVTAHLTTEAPVAHAQLEVSLWSNVEIEKKSSLAKSQRVAIGLNLNKQTDIFGHSNGMEKKFD